MTLEAYLRKKYADKTVRTHLLYINKYLQYKGERRAKKAMYIEIVKYIGVVRKRENNNPSYLINNLQAIKKYYDYLIEIKQRKDHPCKDLRLKDKPNKFIQLQDLFKEEELELLLEREEYHQEIKVKNQVVLTLLIYQGLSMEDLTNLKVHDIDLKEGTVFIKAKKQTNSRTLHLRPKQVMLMYEYLKEERRKLLSKQKKETDRLILTWKGTPENGEGINYLVSSKKHLFPERNLNPKTIRMSVIANLLKQGKDLRVVQVFAGHKSASTTEKYKQTQVEELQHEINKYHPLG